MSWHLAHNVSYPLIDLSERNFLYKMKIITDLKMIKTRIYLRSMELDFTNTSKFTNRSG